MKSIAAYYTLIAANSLEQEARQRHSQAREAQQPRPSLIARARALLAPSRPSQPASTAA